MLSTEFDFNIALSFTSRVRQKEHIAWSTRKALAREMTYAIAFWPLDDSTRPW
jgi:hypothetical protein